MNGCLVQNLLDLTSDTLPARLNTCCVILRNLGPPKCPSTRASTRNHFKELFATERTFLPNWLISCRNTSELCSLFGELYSLVWTLQRALLVNSDRCSVSFARSCGRTLKLIVYRSGSFSD